MSVVRQEAKKVVDNLPDDASWDDVMYEIYVRKKIDEGIKAADRGELLEYEQVKNRFKSKWK